MEWLNFHHLRYFWAVAREGGVTRASQKLHISQPTVSAQVRELEEALGAPLFVREGRTVRLTEIGQVVYRYADEIFGLGQELLDAVRGRPTGQPVRFVVGVADAVPKLVAHRLLAPALKLPEPIHLVCHEDTTERLLVDLAAHTLDLVIADVPVGSSVRVKAYDHLLGESPVEVFGAEALVAPRRRGFPGTLDGAPFLMPMRGATLRRELEEWFDAHKVRPVVTGEFEDGALLKVFGQEGRGLFAAPAAIAREVKRQYRVARLGRLEGLHERFYAISVERRLKHPAVVALSQAAREVLFRT